MDYINIGPSPCDEKCIQVNGEGDYVQAQKAECRRFIRAIRSKLGEEPPGARLAVRGFPHDFGMYYEVICEHDGSEAAVDYAYRCESEAPNRWPLDEEYVRLLVPNATITAGGGNFVATVENLEANQTEAIVKSPYYTGLHRGSSGIEIWFRQPEDDKPLGEE